MKKVLVIIGTRPEAIKMAPVINALNQRSDLFQTRVCLTAQHREMLDQVVGHFNLSVDYDLDIMKKEQTLPQLTASITKALDPVMDDSSSDIILVQGDTTTAFVGALVGYYHQIQVGHVEAGLRTQNKFAPFPEEMNRRLVATLADHHFAPTERAKHALLNEGIDEERILVSGNTVVDALLLTLDILQKSRSPLTDMEPILSDGRKMVLITGHRRENFGRGFKNICEALRELAQRFRECHFVYPVHLNPNVQDPVFRILSGMNNIHLIPPVSYLPFVWLMNVAHIILTDSGGIQEEAPSLGKPVLVMRKSTERPEAVEAGTARLVGANRKKIVEEVSRLLTDEQAWESMSKLRNPYGDGKAAGRIVAYLENLTV